VRMPRVVLTLIWLVSFFLCLLAVEVLIGRTGSDGIALLLEEDRLDAMKPVFLIYGGYLTGILGSWFLKPFPRRRAQSDEVVRRRLAFACTVGFNAFVLYMLWRGVFVRDMQFEDYLRQTYIVAGWLSILVAPVNVYYFGMKLGAHGAQAQPA
jgi:hypothetical protein